MRVRVVLAAVFLVASLSACATSYQSERSRIMAEAELNNAGAQGAPQQAVAAEWAIRDLAALHATQNTENSALLYAVVGLLALSFIATLIIASRLNRTNDELAGMRKALEAALMPTPEPPPGPTTTIG